MLYYKNHDLQIIKKHYLCFFSHLFIFQIIDYSETKIDKAVDKTTDFLKSV